MSITRSSSLFRTPDKNWPDLGLVMGIRTKQGICYSPKKIFFPTWHGIFCRLRWASLAIVSGGDV